jgi:hypothetical protein
MIEQPNNDDSDSFQFESWIILIKQQSCPYPIFFKVDYQVQQKETEFTTLLEALSRFLDRT